jgi:predicted RNA-binding protein with PUA-like domain
LKAGPNLTLKIHYFALPVQEIRALSMNYWLVKSEPSVYSWDQFNRDGDTCWSGIRNYAARIHLNGMRKGDAVMYYHSNEGLEVVGIAKVTREAYQDPTTEDQRWVAVNIAPFKALKKPVSLKIIKSDKRLKDIALVRIGRLSVMPLTKTEYDVLLELSAISK